MSFLDYFRGNKKPKSESEIIANFLVEKLKEYKEFLEGDFTSPFGLDVKRAGYYFNMPFYKPTSDDNFNVLFSSGADELESFKRELAKMESFDSASINRILRKKEILFSVNDGLKFVFKDNKVLVNGKEHKKYSFDYWYSYENPRERLLIDKSEQGFMIHWAMKCDDGLVVTSAHVDKNSIGFGIFKSDKEDSKYIDYFGIKNGIKTIIKDGKFYDEKNENGIEFAQNYQPLKDLLDNVAKHLRKKNRNTDFLDIKNYEKPKERGITP